MRTFSTLVNTLKRTNIFIGLIFKGKSILFRSETICTFRSAHMFFERETQVSWRILAYLNIYLEFLSEAPLMNVNKHLIRSEQKGVLK